MKVIFIRLKKNLFSIIFILIALCLILFSKSNLSAAKEGLYLWANNVVPSLFPFFVITELLSYTNVIHYIGKLFDKLMRPLFHVPGECAYAFFMGLISGYPTGGKVVSSMREQGLCTKDEGDRMLAFTNNSGPLFIVSCVGVSMFGDTKTGFLLLITHILAAISVGIILGKLSTKNSKFSPNFSTKHIPKSNNLETITLSNLGKILGKSIQNAISTVLVIGGFVVTFSVFLSILNSCNILDYLSKLLYPIFNILNLNLSFCKPVLSGIIELTNGVSQVSIVPIKELSQNVTLCAFLLGFGGFSVLFQVYSMLSKTDLSMKKYFFGKLLQGILAAFYTYILLKLFPTLSLDLVPTCASVVDTIVYPISFFGISNYILLILILFFIVFLAFSHHEAPPKYRKTK